MYAGLRIGDEAAQTQTQAAQHETPRTNQDALLEKWRDVRDMAETLVYTWYDSERDHFFFPDEFRTQSEEEAVEHEIAWLLSPATTTAGKRRRNDETR